MKNKFENFLGLILITMFVIASLVIAFYYNREERKLIESYKEHNVDLEQFVIYCEDKNDSLQVQKFQEALKEIYEYDY